MKFSGSTRRAFLPAALVLAAACAGMAGCATDQPLRDSDKLALYRAHAGAPVDSFRYLGSLQSWTPLGDEAVAVWTRPNEAWLLDLSGPCPDLSFAPAIGVTSQMGQVSAKFDKVLPRGGGATMHVPCQIQQIRPLDAKALKQAEREARSTQPSGT